MPFAVSAETEALKMKLKGTVQNLGQGQFKNLPSLKIFAQN
jgi:acylphosphatase